MAYHGWVLDMEAVFTKGSTPSAKLLQARMRAAWGEPMVNFWKTVIQDTVKGRQAEKDGALSMVFRVLRGMFTPALAVGRLSSVVTQMITSGPQSATETLPGTHWRGLPILFDKGIREKAVRHSPFMRNRVFDSFFEGRAEDLYYDRKLYRKGRLTARGVHKAALDFAGKGLALADAGAVLPVWYGHYSDKIHELREAHGFQRRDGGLFDAPDKYRREAVMYADLKVRKTQPSDKEYDQPLYMRSANEAVKTLTAFQAPFAVMLQQFTHDIPRKFKSGETREVLTALYGIGTIMLTAALMGRIHDKDRDGPDDGEERARRLLSYLLGGDGLSGSLPIIGGIVSALTEAAIEGEQVRPYQGVQVFPVAGEVYKLYNALKRDDNERAAMQGAKIGTLSLGLGYGTLLDFEAARRYYGDDALRFWLCMAGFR